MYSLLIIFITCTISFLGSVQLGPVNVMVIRYTLHKAYRDAFILGLAGSLPEIIWSILAIKTNELSTNFPLALEAMLWISAPTFMLIGIYFMFKKPSSKLDSMIQSSSKNSFILGFTLALFNPLLLPFWILVLNTYNAYGLTINTLTQQIVFTISTAVGAFLLQLSLILLIRKYHHRFEKYFQKLSNPLTGLLFVVIAIIQALQLI